MTHGGTQVPKHYLYVLKDGAMVVDWGEGQVQDVMSGDFQSFKDSDIGHPMTDRELDVLMLRGRVVSYDSRCAYLAPLPEGTRKTLD